MVAAQARWLVSTLAAHSLLLQSQPNVQPIVQPSAYASFAPTYDSLNGGAPSLALGVDGLRTEAARFVQGDVIETCVGTALQSRFYDWSRIRSFAGVDLSEEMLTMVRLS